MVDALLEIISVGNNNACLDMTHIWCPQLAEL
jgi:hypothetical protein